jgi:pantetheine-phosphate adenylyltransferase
MSPCPNRRIIYPGTFDPVTLGHEDLARRAAALFDEVVVAVAAQTPKKTIFPLAERVALAEATLGRIDKVRVRAFDGLLVHLLAEEQTPILLRGLRAISDFEHEFQLASINRRMDAHTFLSSSLVREISRLGGDVSAFVQAPVAAALQQRFAHGPQGLDHNGEKS